MIILCDFDDTAAEQNVAQLLLEHFADGAWPPLRQEYRRGAITFREYQERAFQAVRQPREALKQYVREHSTLRPGFIELARYCKGHDVFLAIVTLGLDFYVDALLEKHGLEYLPRYAAQAIFTHNGLEYRYANASPDCPRWGNCKCSILRQYQAQGHRVIYIGDGVSDFCPAPLADMVFAREPLLSLCREREISHRELTNFQEVIQELEAPEAQR
ncbi:MAG: MtnX-like HAD-IB family phosphatase [Chloroflexi bacterium]|nr:MtnX-like HAD-IB family phosphatase [Chloroflexota bacterium]